MGNLKCLSRILESFDSDLMTCILEFIAQSDLREEEMRDRPSGKGSFPSKVKNTFKMC